MIVSWSMWWIYTVRKFRLYTSIIFGYLSSIPSVCVAHKFKNAYNLNQSVVEKLPSFVKLVSLSESQFLVRFDLVLLPLESSLAAVEMPGM